MRWLVPLLVAAALACSGGGSGGVGKAPDPTTPVKVVVVAETASAPSVAAAGVLVAERSVVLRAEASGLVASVGFDHGDAVRQGDVLLRLVDGDARASLAEAEAQVTLAAAQLERARGLFARDHASRAEVDRAEAEHALALARRDGAREGVRRTSVRAPFSGVAGLREVTRGDWVQPGRAVTTLTDPSELAAEFTLPERELALVPVGAAAQVTVDAAPGRAFDGEVTFVAPELDAATRTARVRVTVRGSDAALRPGSTARVVVSGASAPALRVPTNAVLATARGSAVYVVGADGKAELRPVTTAERDAATLRVVEGLSAGDRVVVEGLIRLRPGAPVRVLE